MKFLLVLLLAGLGLAAASSVLPHSHKEDVQLYDDFENFHEAVLAAEDNEEVKSLRKRLEELMEILQENRDNGKPAPRETLLEMKNILDDMEKKGVKLTIAEKIVKWTVDFYLKRSDSPLYLHDLLAHDDPTTELGRILKKHFEEILEKVQDIIDNGKTYKEDLGEKLKEIAQKLKDMKVDIGDHAKDVLKKLKDKAKDYWKKILDKITPGSDTKDLFSAEGDDLAKNLRERFEEILEKIKDAIENRKVLGGNVVAKLKEIYQQMKEKSIPFGDKAKELLEQMKEKATGIWKRILDRINPSKRFVEARGTGAENLRERLLELLEKLKESFRDRKLPGKGFISKLRQIRDEMRQKNVPLGGKLKEMIDKLKENANGVWRRILDRIGQHSPSRAEEIGAESLRGRLQELLEQLKEAVRNRRFPGIGIFSKLKKIREEMRLKNISLGGKLREMINQLKENFKGALRRILERIGMRDPSGAEEDQYARNLRDRLNEILDLVKDGFVTRTTIGGQHLFHLETVWNEMKAKSIPPGERAIQLIQELKKMTNGEWKSLLFKILPDEE